MPFVGRCVITLLIDFRMQRLRENEKHLAAAGRWCSSICVFDFAGYARIALAVISFYFMQSHYIIAGWCYIVSALLDAIDGHAARAFDQSKLNRVIELASNKWINGRIESLAMDLFSRLQARSLVGCSTSSPTDAERWDCSSRSAFSIRDTCSHSRSRWPSTSPATGCTCNREFANRIWTSHSLTELFVRA